VDEFAFIKRYLRPLASGAPEALELMDDAAVIPSRPGFDLVVTKDALVGGVHFLDADPLGRVAQKGLRVNLSDLAAKAAEPYGYFLAVAWPPQIDEAGRAAFAAGLALDQGVFDLRLFGGDTVSTPGPLSFSLTLLGWVRSGAMVRRSGARPGDRLLVSGAIGDGGLGLKAARGEPLGLSAAHTEALKQRYALPTPRLELCSVLHSFARSAADVSDGLLADALHLTDAEALGLTIDLAAVPVSAAAAAWLGRQSDEGEARLILACAGDDYEIVFACAPEAAEAAIRAAAARAILLTDIGAFTPGGGLQIRWRGQSLSPSALGFTHP
jgi:thiamine-monophosphate kinase